MTKRDVKVNNKWKVQVLEDGKTKELYIEIPTDLLNQMGWDAGTDLEWFVDDGTWSIKKKVDKKPYMYYNIY